jgi:hypothetical protein
MGSEGCDITTAAYWGQLKAWGLSNRRRVTAYTYTMLDMEGEVVNVPCPGNLSPAERQAALQLIASTHLRAAH